MSKPSPAIITPAAIRTDLGAIFVALELSRSRWVVTSLSPGDAGKMSRQSMPGGDPAGLMERFRLHVAKARARKVRDFPIITIQEAGLDRDLASAQARQDRQDRRRGTGARAAGFQSGRAAGLRQVVSRMR